MSKFLVTKCDACGSKTDDPQKDQWLEVWGFFAFSGNEKRPYALAIGGTPGSGNDQVRLGLQHFCNEWCLRQAIKDGQDKATTPEDAPAPVTPTPDNF